MKVMVSSCDFSWKPIKMTGCNRTYLWWAKFLLVWRNK